MDCLLPVSFWVSQVSTVCPLSHIPPTNKETEGGLYPGIIYYVTTWYSRADAQYRQALFFASASLAGAFSGLLAFAIAVSSSSFAEQQFTDEP